MAHEAQPPLIFTLAPHMESPKWHRALEVPRGEGWSKTISDLLLIQRIGALGSPSRRSRRTGKGKAAKALEAKLCAAAFLPYKLSASAARGAAGAAQLDDWGWLPLDLDKVGISVEELLTTIEAAFGDVQRASWTTWSCKDGRASARVIIPLSRSATYQEVCALWWWAWDRLKAAGLPETGYDGKEPSLDPRLDAKAYLLPAMPSSGVAGEEDWGGTIPRGVVGDDDEPLLDVEAVLPLGRAVEAAERESFAARWDSIPLPGGRGKASRTGGKLPLFQASRKGKTAASSTAKTSVRADFGAVRFAGTTLREWADQHLGLGQEVSVGSPWRSDGGSGLEGQSLRLHREATGRLWAHDFGSDTTYLDLPGATWSQGVPTVYQPPKSSGKVKPGERLTQRASGSWQLDVSKADLLHGQYLDLEAILQEIEQEIEVLEKAGKPHPTKEQLWAVVWKAGQGRGKTEVASVFVKTALRRGLRAICVSPTRSLSRDSARRYQLGCYLDEAESGHLNGSIATCSQSLYRVPLCDFTGAGPSLDLTPDGAGQLVLDEVEQMIASWGGKHLKDHQARDAYHACVNHLKITQHATLLDADAGELTESLLAATGRDLAGVLWIVAPGAEARRLRVFPIHSEGLAECLRVAQTGRVAVACQSVTEAEAAGLILPLWNGLPNLVLDKHTVDQYDLSKINELLLTHGHLIFTPVLGTGVSIDVKAHFQQVFGFLSDAVGTATTALQLLSRVRSPINREIVVSRLGGGGRVPAAWEADAEDVKARWFRREGLTLQKVGFHRELPASLFTVVAGSLQIDRDTYAYVDLMARAHAQQVRQGLGRVVDSLQEMVASLGWEVVVEDAANLTEEGKVASGARKEARKEVVGKAIRQIVQAEDLDEKALAKARRRGADTRQEALGLQRASIDRFYGKGSADDEALVRWDDSGKGRRRARAFAHAVAASEGGKAAETLRRLDYKEVERGVSAVRLQHRTVRSRALAGYAKRLLGGEIAELAGGGGQHSSSTTSSPGSAGHSPVYVSQKAAQEIAERLSSPFGLELAAILGITVRSDAEENPMQLAASILGACGLKVRPERSQVKGVRARRYTIDLEDLAVVVARSTVYLEALRSGKVGVDTSEEGGGDTPQETPAAEVINLDRWRAFDARLMEQARLLEEGIESYGT